MEKVQLICKNHKPYGIRDETGFLFFFSKISKYSGQEERYRLEIKEQFDLADDLVIYLKNRAPIAQQPLNATDTTGSV